MSEQHEEEQRWLVPAANWVMTYVLRTARIVRVELRSYVVASEPDWACEEPDWEVQRDEQEAAEVGGRR